MCANKNNNNENSVYNKPLTLTNIKSSYDKLQKEMNKPPSDYETIKTLMENQNNSITHVQNNINKKSKNIVEMKSHNKLKKIK